MKSPRRPPNRGGADCDVLSRQVDRMSKKLDKLVSLDNWTELKKENARLRFENQKLKEEMEANSKGWQHQAAEARAWEFTATNRLRKQKEAEAKLAIATEALDEIIEMPRGTEPLEFKEIARIAKGKIYE